MKHVKLSVFCTLMVGLLALTAVAGSVTAQDSTPAPISISLGYSVWVGYGPLFIAKAKGYFADEGLDVNLVDVENPADRFTALAGGQLSGLVTTLDTLSQYCNAETPFKAILGLDESSGGDGIVANSSIKTVADLKGKQIGVNKGTVSQFLLEYLLQKNGMSDSDVTLVNMSQGDVPAALAAGQVDAGVTWAPNLGAAEKNGANLVIDSKSTPGLIADILVLRQDVMDQNPTVPSGLVAAWYKAIEYWKANPDDAADIMAKGLGGFYTSGADIDADLEGATLFDEAKNQSYFGGTDSDASETLSFATDFYSKIGVITNPCTPDKLIDSSYVLPAGMATAEATGTMEATAEMTATSAPGVTGTAEATAEMTGTAEATGTMEATSEMTATAEMTSTPEATAAQ